MYERNRDLKQAAYSEITFCENASQIIKDIYFENLEWSESTVHVSEKLNKLKINLRSKFIESSEIEMLKVLNIMSSSDIQEFLDEE